MSTPTPPGDRIAKVLARAGVASRREAERMIAEGRIKVNGAVIDSPALNVTASDRVLVDGKPLPVAEPARLWLYHKPPGLVTTAKDDKGRPTIFDGLPPEMPRVMSIGRLDLNSEGLLLLTNDGALKRRLELPSTGWLRRYRVRINGQPTEESLEPLRKGLTIGEERFLPMTATLDRQQGANAWLTIGLREGKNREIRRAMEDLGFTVNRLIRVSYGPFQLGTLQAGEVEEIRRKVLRDQLGEGVTEPPEAPAKPRRGGPQRAGAGDKPRLDRPRRAEEGKKPTRERSPRAEAGDKPARVSERIEKPARVFKAKSGAAPARRGSPDGAPRSPKGGKPRPPSRKGRSSP